MAKTVFGMPGVGKKIEGGDAIAPGGTPGAKQKGALPQKSGKETSTPEKEPPRETSKPLAAESKPSMPKPAAAPMAKPAAAPMAKPAAAPTPKPAAAKSKAGNAKTMFGMPAMKLPSTPGGSPTQTTPPAEPLATPSQPKTPAAKPAGGAENDAYKATVLGMVAVDPSVIPQAAAPPEEDAAPDKTFETGPKTQEQDKDLVETDTDSTGGSAKIATTGPMDSFDEANEYAPMESQSKFPLWLIIAIIVIVAFTTIIGAYFIFRTPQPSVKEPTGVLEMQVEKKLSQNQIAMPVSGS